jgi:peroxiredoxin
MRDAYQRFRAARAEVVAIAPSPIDEVLAAARDLRVPFPCLADPDRIVFRQYEVGSSGRSLGQRPGVFLIGPKGQIERAWKGRQQWEIPSVDEVLQALEEADTDADSRHRS